MCGICGYITTRPNTAKIAKSMIANLLVASEVRGSDASGIAFVKNNKIVCVKDGVKASIFTKSKKFIEIIEKNNPEIMIAHTRQQTQGTHTDNKNNHPLVDGNIAIVHNGIISNDREVFTTFKLKRDGFVDSEAIVKLIAYYKKDKLTTREAIQSAIKNIQGSLAVAIINANNDRELHLIRDTNPISLAYHKPTGIIYFASTDDILLNGLSEHKKVFFIFDDIIDQSNDYLLSELDNNTGYRLTANKITSYAIETKAWNSYTVPATKTTAETIADAVESFIHKKPKYIKITDFTKPIKRPSLVSSDDLEFRLAMLDEENQNGILTAYELSEIKRIDNCLFDREQKEAKKSNKIIYTGANSDYYEGLNDSLDHTKQPLLPAVS